MAIFSTRTSARGVEETEDDTELGTLERLEETEEGIEEATLEETLLERLEEAKLEMSEEKTLLERLEEATEDGTLERLEETDDGIELALEETEEFRLDSSSSFGSYEPGLFGLPSEWQPGS